MMMNEVKFSRIQWRIQWRMKLKASAHKPGAVPPFHQFPVYFDLNRKI